MIKFFLLLIFFLPTFLSADQAEPCYDQGRVAPMDPELIRETLLRLWVSESPLNNRGEPLEVSVEEIEYNEGIVTLHLPQLGGRLINYRSLICAETGRNWLGFETCERQVFELNGNRLCQDLGFSGYVSSKSSSVGSNNVNSIYYPNRQTDEGQWDTLRVGSALAPNYRVNIISTVSCQTNVRPR